MLKSSKVYTGKNVDCLVEEQLAMLCQYYPAPEMKLRVHILIYIEFIFGYRRQEKVSVLIKGEQEELY